MLDIRYQSRFRRDVRLLARRGYDMQRLQVAIELLQADQALPEQYHDHALSGNWSGFRECHVGPDWLLVYKVIRSELVLVCVRTGTHSDILDI